MPGEVGAHADQTWPRTRQVVVDGPQVQVVGLGDAEVPLDVFEVLVGGDTPRNRGADAGADDVDAVEGGRVSSPDRAVGDGCR